VGEGDGEFQELAGECVGGEEGGGGVRRVAHGGD